MESKKIKDQDISRRPLSFLIVLFADVALVLPAVAAAQVTANEGRGEERESEEKIKREGGREREGRGGGEEG